MDQQTMLERPVSGLVFSMSFPMVLSMLVNALYNIVDSYFVAKISGEAMTALSLVFPLQNLICAVGVGFGIGINAAAAFYLGAGDVRKADDVVTQGVILNTLHGIILTFACILSIPMFLRSFTEDVQVLRDGSAYSVIVFLFATVQTLGGSFEKIFQAAGRMKASMSCMLAGCILNIVLDPLLIFGAGPIPGMGVCAAAIATGLGQTASLAAYLILLLIRPLPVKIRLRKGLSTDKSYRRIYAVGIPAILNMALPSLLIAMLNGILAQISQVYVLILGIYYKLQTFIYLTANGIVQGIRPLVGFSYGAGRPDRIKKIVKSALIFGSVILAAGTLLCMLLPAQLMGLYSTDPLTIQEGEKALRIISCGFMASTISVVLSGTFEGLGKGMASLTISMIRYIAIIPTAFVLSLCFQATGVWNAFWITEVAAALVSLVLLGRYGLLAKIALPIG